MATLLLDGGAIGRAHAQSQPSPAPAQTTDQPAAEVEPIGNVVNLTGSATVTRNKVATPLRLKDDIYLNDVVQTAAASKLGITFNDATTFNLSASSRIAVDSYVYEDGGKQNAAVFDVARGTVAFVAAAVAKTGGMTITTPTATMGIRGTTGVVEVPDRTTPAQTGGVAIKLYPDPDGRVGRIEVSDRAGARLGALTAAASGFAIRPGVGGARLSAVPLVISAQQAARDQGFVRQVHAAQVTGRRIVTEQRALRRASPDRNRPGALPPGQRPGNPVQPNRPGAVPARPDRQGSQPPGQPRQAAPADRPVGLPQTGPGQRSDRPALPAPGAARPALRDAAPPPPGAQRPGMIGRPGAIRPPAPVRRPPPPKGKRPPFEPR